MSSGREIEAVAAREPFDVRAVERSKGKLQVSFLKRKPTATSKKKVLALASEEDLLALSA